MNFRIKKGLDLPISGQAQEELDLSKTSKKVAVLGSDFTGMKPTMKVKEGESVKTGQLLFECKKNIGLRFTAPGAGKVVAINRGERRVFQSMVIELDEKEEQVSFENYKSKAPSELNFEEVKALLVESGEWKYIRQRPFEKVADLSVRAHSLFITAMDTNPLAPKPSYILDQYKEEFKAGVEALSKLPQDKTYICLEKGQSTGVKAPGVEEVYFSGPHPAGNVGTHIHFVDPVHAERQVWHISYQDVVAVGKLFLSGDILKDKVISLAGPMVKIPRYLKVRRGAQISELVKGECKDLPTRVISGSVLSGHKADGAFDYLGAFDKQISCIEEDRKRELLGWQSPGFNKFSVKNIYFSKLMPSKKFAFGSSTHGSKRAIVPIEAFEKVMPLDLEPTALVKALASKSSEYAQELGCLELAEEDMALLSFVSPGKANFEEDLRYNLNIIEQEG